jgi:hypothetical protein
MHRSGARPLGVAAAAAALGGLSSKKWVSAVRGKQLCFNLNDRDVCGTYGMEGPPKAIIGRMTTFFLFFANFLISSNPHELYW